MYKFWLDLLERSAKTAIQVFLSVSGLGAVGIFHLAWAYIGETTLTAFVLSILTSLISGGITAGVQSKASASLVNKENA
jgi:hypothetical membrane protein